MTIVDTVGDVGRYSSLAIGADGFPVISYSDTTNNQWKVVKCNDAACTGAGETITTIGLGTGVGSSLTIGVDGNPVIALQTGSTSTLGVAKCNDPACAGGDEQFTTLTSAADSGNSPSIVIGTDGNPRISYIDNNLSLARLVTCNDPACAGLDEAFFTLGAGSAFLTGTSITLGRDANPVVTYQDGLGFDMTVAKVTHTSWTRYGSE